MTDKERERFKKIIEEYESSETGCEIGTLNEGMLHAVIKRFIADGEGETEVRISGKNIADVIKGDTVYEIQTENLYPVKKKLDFYLSKTDYNVNVVFPIPREKYLCWSDPESGELSRMNRSPKSRSLVDYADTLIYLTEYVSDPRLTLTVLYISECEYRNLDGKRSRDKKRGSTRIERVPLDLLGIETFKGVRDYSFLLPPAISAGAQGERRCFTLKEYAKVKKLTSKRRTACAVKMMTALGLIRLCGKKGRANLYEVTEDCE